MSLQPLPAPTRDLGRGVLVELMVCAVCGLRAWVSVKLLGCPCCEQARELHTMWGEHG